MAHVKLNDVPSQWNIIKEDCLPKIEKFLESGYYIGNPIIEEFEDSFSEYIGSKYAVAVSNGTDGLKLGLQALNLKGKVCIVIPANTFVSNALAASYFNYDIKLIDCDDFYGMKADDLHAWFVGKRETYDDVVVVPVHLYGYPTNLERIMSLCRLFDAHLIEDCSQAHGAMIRLGKVGNFGILSVFSCYAGKNLAAAGEGGIITTNDTEIQQSIKTLRNVGSSTRYEHTTMGWNNRPQALQCLILNEKLKYLDEWNSYRSYSAEAYNKKLKGLPIVLPKEPEWAAVSAFHLYVIRTSQRDDLQAFLKKRNIETGIHYPIPIAELEVYKDANLHHKAQVNTTKWKDELLSLPLHPFLTDYEIEFVCHVIKEFFNDNV